MPRGGARPGAGKPKGSIASHTVDAQEMRKKIVSMISDKAESLMAAKFDLAHGVYEEKVSADGVVRVYRRAPDGNAIQYLLSQAIGKPKETVELQAEMKLKVDI